MRSAIACLRDEGPADVMELVTTLGAAMLALGGAAAGWEEGRARVERAVADGSGFERLRALVRAQGGDDSVLDHPERLDAAPAVVPFPAPRGGWVSDIDPRALGEAAVDLGAGRRRAEDVVDPRVGIRLGKTAGEAVRAGDVLAHVLAPDAARAERVIRERLAAAFRIEGERPVRRPLVRHLVTAAGQAPWDGDSTWRRLRGDAGAARGRTP
jgi:thymidine phosphorylase